MVVCWRLGVNILYLITPFLQNYCKGNTFSAIIQEIPPKKGSEGASNIKKERMPPTSSLYLRATAA
jgi:hypothetical protein